MAVELAFSCFSSHSNCIRSPIAILHGLFGSKNNWRSLAKKLTDETKRSVYCIDARNHGDSPHTLDMAYTVMCDDVVQLLRTQNVNRGVIMGHSMGGKTAMTMALKYPEFVEKLVVVDVAPVRSIGGLQILEYLKIMKDLDLKLIKNRRDADMKLKEAIPSDSVRSFLLTGLVLNLPTGSMKWRMNLHSIEQNISKFKDFPDFKSEKYTGPSLFIGGENSPYISSDVYPVIKKLFPEAIIKHIKDAGHWVHYDQPIEFENIVKQFLHSKTNYSNLG